MHDNYSGKPIVVPDYLKSKVPEERKLALEMVPQVTTTRGRGRRRNANGK